MKTTPGVWLLTGCIWIGASAALAQAPQPESAGPVRGSIVEDRAAQKLLEAGDARYEVDEYAKAIEVWQSVIERYPRSKVRYEAHLRLGNYLLDRERSFDRARTHFEAVGAEENSDSEQRAQALLKVGVCFYSARNYGMCFKVLREVIEKYPVSSQVNQAYYYIGLGHFQLGHYSRAIEALERVGTALVNEEGSVEKVEAGKRLFVKIEDADLAALGSDQLVKVRCQATSGDAETVSCMPVGHNVRVVLGSIITALGKPRPDDGVLQVRGDDKVKLTYVDQHTSDRNFDRATLKEITVVGDALVDVTDGAYSESLRGVVLGKTVNLQVTDGDFDLTDGADKLTAVVEIYREKTPEEIEDEQAKLTEKPDAAAAIDGEPAKVDPLKLVDGVKAQFIEVKPVRSEAAAAAVISAEGTSTDGADAAAPAAEKPEGAKPADTKPADTKPADTKPADTKPADTKPADAKPADAKATDSKPADAKPAGAKPAAGEQAKDAAAAQPAKPAPPVDDGSIHSGVFRVALQLERADQPKAGDDVLQALPNDILRVTFLDQRHSGEGERKVAANATCVEGNLGGVRVTRAQISDQELRIQTQLKTASALTNIANRYKEFGLKKNADAKYDQALKVCEEIATDARKLGGRLLEDSYVQLWRIYFEMDRLDLAAAMCQRLQREFPQSGFVDDAMLQLADVARKQGDLQRAVGIYSRLVGMPNSQLRGEAQYGIAESYEAMAKANDTKGAQQLYDRAFQEYKKVFDNFPESGRVGEAVAKMANYYYQQKDYARAIDIFETVLSEHPDAKFLDVILFNYGRCLFRLERRGEARKQFDQLIADFPESPLAADAKRISEALAKATAPSGG